MPRPALEVAEIFRSHGPAWRKANAGHLSLGQLKAMAAIEACRTAELGGHVARCEDCGHAVISYNSCGNRHCPKCQGAAARQWLAEREAELLPLPYYHVVFTLPSAISAVAWQNKAEVYGLLVKAASETMLTIAADPRHLGARIGMTAVLHTWGSALTHHPHVHMIGPGGGLSLDGERFVPCRGQRRRFFLPVRVLLRLFRRLVLERLAAAHSQRRLILQGSLAKLAPAAAFAAALKPLRWKKWFVYIKEPFAGPKAVLAYLSRYTHRVAISNTRLIAHDSRGVTFRYKDYRADGLARHKVMTLAAEEFIRRFLLHILPKGFHRIRHYGLFANTGRTANLARLRELLGSAPPPEEEVASSSQDEPAETVLPPCPCCGGRMIVI
ncbi:MAG TPA: IS91 family transposase, partial [Dongiaceae bacterium]